MFRKFFLKRLGKKKKYVILGLIILTLISIGLIIFVAARSSGRETVEKPQGVSEKLENQKMQIPEIRDFTERRLVKIPAKGAGWLGGVLAGFAYYLAIPLWLLRLVFVVAVLWWDDASEFLIIAYILLWIFMPSIDFLPADFIARTG